MMDKKELQHAYFLLNGFVENIDKEMIERNYLLELQKWFIEQFETIEESSPMCKIRSCHSSNFEGIDCLEDEHQYGFFKSEADVRPGHAIWIKKSQVKRLFELFSEVKK